MEIYVLRNVSSGKVMTATNAIFISFDENGRGKGKLEGIEVGSSLVLGLNNYGSYVWLTTIVTEILENTEDNKHFLTQNSEYMLTKTKIKNEFKKGKNNR